MSASKGEHLRLRTGDVVKQRYQVVEEIGCGNFSKVYKCFDLQLPSSERRSKPVAMKVLKKEYKNDASFERRMLRSLSEKDPNNEARVSKMLEYFDWQEYPVFVMPIHGDSLRSRRLGMHRGCVTRSRLVEFAYDVLETLTYIHFECRMVHTDLKPENILLADSHTSLKSLGHRWVICDFGSASFWRLEKLDSDLISTRPYRAPEVVLGNKWHYAADMWSVGCIIYEVAVGSRLFEVRDDVTHLQMMERRLGRLPDIFTTKAKYSPKFFTSKGQHLTSSETIRSGKCNLTPIKDMFREDPQLLTLLHALLTYNPQHRATAPKAMQLPIFEAIREARRLRQNGEAAMTNEESVSEASVPLTPGTLGSTSTGPWDYKEMKVGTTPSRGTSQSTSLVLHQCDRNTSTATASGAATGSSPRAAVRGTLDSSTMTHSASPSPRTMKRSVDGYANNSSEPNANKRRSVMKETPAAVRRLSTSSGAASSAAATSVPAAADLNNSNSSSIPVVPKLNLEGFRMSGKRNTTPKRRHSVYAAGATPRTPHTPTQSRASTPLKGNATPRTSTSGISTGAHPITLSGRNTPSRGGTAHASQERLQKIPSRSATPLANTPRTLILTSPRVPKATRDGGGGASTPKKFRSPPPPAVARSGGVVDRGVRSNLSASAKSLFSGAISINGAHYADPNVVESDGRDPLSCSVTPLPHGGGGSAVQRGDDVRSRRSSFVTGAQAVAVGTTPAIIPSAVVYGASVLETAATTVSTTASAGLSNEPRRGSLKGQSSAPASTVATATSSTKPIASPSTTTTQAPAQARHAQVRPATSKGSRAPAETKVAPSADAVKRKKEDEEMSSPLSTGEARTSPPPLQQRLQESRPLQHSSNQVFNMRDSPTPSAPNTSCGSPRLTDYVSPARERHALLQSDASSAFSSPRGPLQIPVVDSSEWQPSLSGSPRFASNPPKSSPSDYVRTTTEGAGSDAGSLLATSSAPAPTVHKVMPGSTTSLATSSGVSGATRQDGVVKKALAGSAAASAIPPARYAVRSQIPISRMTNSTSSSSVAAAATSKGVPSHVDAMAVTPNPIAMAKPQYTKTDSLPTPAAATPVADRYSVPPAATAATAVYYTAPVVIAKRRQNTASSPRKEIESPSPVRGEVYSCVAHTVKKSPPPKTEFIVSADTRDVSKGAPGAAMGSSVLPVVCTSPNRRHMARLSSGRPSGLREKDGRSSSRGTRHSADCRTSPLRATPAATAGNATANASDGRAVVISDPLDSSDCLRDEMCSGSREALRRSRVVGSGLRSSRGRPGVLRGSDNAILSSRSGANGGEEFSVTMTPTLGHTSVGAGGTGVSTVPQLTSFTAPAAASSGSLGGYTRLMGQEGAQLRPTKRKLGLNCSTSLVVSASLDSMQDVECSSLLAMGRGNMERDVHSQCLQEPEGVNKYAGSVAVPTADAINACHRSIDDTTANMESTPKTGGTAVTSVPVVTETLSKTPRRTTFTNSVSGNCFAKRTPLGQQRNARPTSLDISINSATSVPNKDNQEIVGGGGGHGRRGDDASAQGEDDGSNKNHAPTASVGGGGTSADTTATAPVQRPRRDNKTLRRVHVRSNTGELKKSVSATVTPRSPVSPLPPPLRLS